MPVVPGTPGADLPPGSDALIRRIQELERAVRELAAANPLATAGLVPAPNALTVQGNLNITGTETVSGNLNVTGTETVSGNLSVTGTETVGGALNVTGPMTVGGTLSLPAGIIGNASLTNPVLPLVSHSGANNFGLFTGANVEIVRSTISVPAGYSQALVSVAAVMHAFNQNASWDDAFLAVTVNGSGIGASSQISCSGAQGTALPAHGVGLLTGLGSTLYVSAKASSGSFTWSTSSNNFVNLDTTVLFLR